jgi:hypothetical protein
MMLTSAPEQTSTCLLRRGMPTIFLHVGNFQLAKLGNFQLAKLGNFQLAKTGEFSTGIDS